MTTEKNKRTYPAGGTNVNFNETDRQAKAAEDLNNKAEDLKEDMNNILELKII